MFLQRFEELSRAVSECIYTSFSKNISEAEASRFFFSLIQDVVERKGIVYVIGNGGSAGIASHFSNDLMKALKIPSQTFYDSNLLTCLANDIGYENVFSYPLERLLTSKDMLVAISSSGKSHSITNGAQIALDRGASLITLSGFESSNPLRKLGQLNCWINRADYGLVEMAHFFILHTIIDRWNKNGAEVIKYAHV